MKSCTCRESSKGPCELATNHETESLTMEALKELEKVDDPAQRSEVIAILAPTLAPVQPSTAIALLMEVLEQNAREVNALPRDEDGELARQGRQGRQERTENAIHETLVSLPVDKYRRSLELADELLENPERTKVFIPTGVLNAGELSLEVVRRTHSKDMYARILSAGFAEHPPPSSLVPEVLHAVDEHLGGPAKAMAYARFLNRWPSQHKPHLAKRLIAEARALTGTDGLLEVIEEVIMGDALAGDDFPLAWNLLQMADPEGEDLWILLSEVAKILPINGSLAGGETFLGKVKSRLDREADPDSEGYATLMMARISLSNFLAFGDANGALQYAYRTAEALMAYCEGTPWLVAFPEFARLHRLTGRFEMPGRFVEGTVSSATESVPWMVFGNPCVVLCQHAEAVSQMEVKGAEHLLRAALRLSAELEKDALGRHSERFRLALCAKRTGVDIGLPSVPDLVRQIAVATEAQGNDFHPLHPLVDALRQIVWENPELAPEVYPVLCGEEQFDLWFETLYSVSEWDASMKDPLRELAQSAGELARQRPQGYHRAKCLAIAARLCEPLSGAVDGARH